MASEELQQYLPEGALQFGSFHILPQPELPDKDAREYALVRLGDFIAALVFRRTGDKDKKQTIPFRIPRESIHHYNPNDGTELTPPAVGLVPGKGVDDIYWLGPPRVIEESKDVYGTNTVLVDLGEYVEEFMIEIFSAKHAERRAVVAGLKDMLRSLQNTSALWLSLPDYFDRVAIFELTGSEYVEDPDTIRNRRRAFLSVTLRVQQVRLVNYVPLDVSLTATIGVEVNTNCVSSQIQVT